MSSTAKHIQALKLIGGELALDFTNTAGWRGEPGVEEVLRDYQDLAVWAHHAGALNDEQRDGLLRLAKSLPFDAQAVFQRSIELREALYRGFAALAAADPVDDADLACINQAVAESGRHLRLAPGGDHLAWQWYDADALEFPIWLVARSAAELLVSDRLPRVRKCEGDKCDWLFVDASRNHSRRWCDMADCGNRAKAKRNYAKRRAEATPRTEQSGTGS